VASSVQRGKVWLTPTTRVSCSNAAKTRNPLKFAGVPQTNETISAASGPKFPILCGHVEEILLHNNFFPIVDTCLSCEDMDRQSCGVVPRWRLFMVALCNRADHYIFACDFYLLSVYLSSFFIPRLISAVADWMSTILLHMA